jgi:hypothetical protein
MATNNVGGYNVGVSVVVATYGDHSVWGPMAERAIASAKSQTVTDMEVISCHADSLHEARNAAAMKAWGKYLIFLDADDTLDRNYVKNMLDAAHGAAGPTLFQPSTLGVREDGVEDTEPVLIRPADSLLTRNHMVIGTMLERRLFMSVGGFRDFQMYEDWDLWLRCWIYGGARWTAVPEAIYRVLVREGSRNNQDASLQVATYNKIRQEHLPVAREKGLA